MDTIALNTTQIDTIIKDIWTTLSEAEREQFLKEIQIVDKQYHLEIQANLTKTHIS